MGEHWRSILCGTPRDPEKICASHTCDRLISTKWMQCTKKMYACTCIYIYALWTLQFSLFPGHSCLAKTERPGTNCMRHTHTHIYIYIYPSTLSLFTKKQIWFMVKQWNSNHYTVNYTQLINILGQKLGMVNPGLYSGSIRSLIYNLLGTIRVYLTGGFNLARLCIIVPNRRKIQKNACNILESPPNLFIPGDQYATLIHEIAYPTIQC